MAQIDDGDSRSANVELNLVPFIDLMSVCITFLLITAVWTQVSMISIGSSIYGKKREGDPELNIDPKDNIVLRVDVVKKGHIVVFGTETFLVARKGEELDDQRLLQELSRIKERVPDKDDAIITILDELPYDDLIRSMDQVLAAGFPQIGVAPGESM